MEEEWMRGRGEMVGRDWEERREESGCKINKYFLKLLDPFNL